MRNWTLVFALLFGLHLTAQEAEWTSVKDINPYIGTGGHGHTHPSAQAPFGMIQLGPNTRYDGWDGCSGYHYSDSAMYGFTSTHLSGTGVSDYGDLLMLPFSSPTQEGDHVDFFKADEHAQAGYYACKLQDGTRIEATAGDRIGKLRIHYPEGGQPGMMVDLNFRDRVLAQDFSALGKGTFEGRRISEGWAREQHFYFGFTMAPAPDSVWQISPGVYWLSLPEGSRAAEVSIGMSGTSTAGAWNNYHGEKAERDFEEVFNETQEKWEKELAKTKVKSASADERAIFATALYHAYAVPNVWSDVDGSYRGQDNVIYRDTVNRHYTVFSLWDTYRTAHPLYTITQPERTQEFVYGMLDMYKQRGRLPIWELAGNETDCMIGYHSVSVLADAIGKGYHTDTALTMEAMRATAEMDVFGLDAYKQFGFLSIENESESVSKTMEYAYDDACIAWTAERLNDLSAQMYYQQRSAGYRSLIDPESGFVRPRTNGDFLSPYQPQEVNNHFTEANAYQYSFSPVHDLEGWMEILTNFRSAREGWNSLPARKERGIVKSRHDVLEELLDHLFEASSATTGREQADITGLIGQYAHGNEPSHHIAYLYNATNNAGKASYWVNEILNTQYQNTPDGLSGNEDCGQMSAWYVMASMGLYPLAPGQPHYQLSTPMWDEIQLEVAGGKTLEIHTQGSGLYLQNYDLGGQDTPAFKRRFVTHEQLLKGGKWNAERGDQDTYINLTQRYATTMNNPTPPAPIIRVPRTFTGNAKVEILPVGNFEMWSHRRSENVTWKKDIKGRERQGTATGDGFITAVTPHYGYGDHIAKAFFSKRDDNLSASWVVGEPSPQYTAGGAHALIDGITGDTDWRKGHWAGIYQQDAILQIDLRKAKPIGEIHVGVLKDIRAWIAAPEKVEVQVQRGKDPTWEHFGTYVFKNPLGQEESVRHDILLKNDGTLPVKSVRILFFNAGALQEWHPGAGFPSYFFTDEIRLVTPE